MPQLQKMPCWGTYEFHAWQIGLRKRFIGRASSTSVCQNRAQQLFGKLIARGNSHFPGMSSMRHG